MSGAQRARGTALATMLAVAGILASLLAASAGAGPTAGAAEFQAQVVGGTPVPNGKYPSVAALLDTRGGSTAYQQQYCGGTLIDRNSVLTAAHCVSGQPRARLRVAVGRTVLDSHQGQVRGVSRVFVHPRYAASDAYDAAVLRLDRPVSGITPIRLATARQNALETPGRLATIAGWGDTSQQPPEGGNASRFPQRMREARPPLVSDATASSVYGSSFVPQLMVAAGREGVDTCQGDSGGPMFVPVRGPDVQIGITSFGAGCGARGFSGVYTEVNASAIRSFITGAAAR